MKKPPLLSFLKVLLDYFEIFWYDIEINIQGDGFVDPSGRCSISIAVIKALRYFECTRGASFGDRFYTVNLN